MSERQIINDYLEGRIGQWALYRRLVKIGISVSTALTLTVGLPAVMRGQETLDGLASKSNQARKDDFAELDRLLRMVGHALTHAVETGNLNSLAVGVAKLGVNVDAPLNEPVALNLDGSAGGVPIALSGWLTNLGQDGDVRMMQLSVEGNVGESALNLTGNVEAPGDASGVNLGNAGLNFIGNAGRVPLNFSGNIGNVVATFTGDTSGE